MRLLTKRSVLLAAPALVLARRSLAQDMTLIGAGSPSKVSGGGAATTWDPANKFQITLSGGNLTATNSVAGGGNFGVTRSTTSHASGNFYIEWLIAITTVDQCGIGVCNSSQAISSGAQMGAGANNVGTINNATTVRFNSTDLGNFSGVSPANGDTIGMAINVSSGLGWWRLNSGNWNNSGTAVPGSPGSGGFSLGVTGALFLFCDVEASTINGTLKPGPTYSFTAPGGFGSW